MGLAKRQMMEEDDQGWSFTDAWVCTGCVNDLSLRAVVEGSVQPDESCSFCDAANAAPLDVLIEAFVDGLKTEYEDALEGVSWDGREGGFQWSPKWETWELVSEFDDVLVGPGLVDAVAGAMHDRTWVERDFASPRVDEALAWGWEEFCHAIKHETRYVFWLRNEDDDGRYGVGEVPAARVLHEIGRLVDTLGLVRTLSAHSEFARARPSSADSDSWDAADLGTAPIDKSIASNRMSPAGIPMFYGARDASTAIAEVRSARDAEHVSYGWFATSRPCSVIDFTHLRPPPSMFDREQGHLRRYVLFLRRFVEELRTTPRPGFAEIDYVPTQVVTEYFLRIFRSDGEVIGLIYPSSITNGDCVVLDVSHDRCVPQDDGWDQREDLVLGFAGDVIESPDKN